MKSGSRRAQLEKVTESVWFARGPASNWVVLHRGGDVILIDAGYPEDAAAVAASIVETGRSPREVRQVFVTHAHTDHIGGIPELLSSAAGAEVLCDPRELAAVRGPVREQITLAKAGRRLLDPRFARWALHAVRAGGTRTVEIPRARGFTEADLRSAGLIVRPAGGHTPGSVMYEIAGEGVLVTGDAYITDHPTYAAPRTGAIDPVFSADPLEASRAADRVSAGMLVLPGHGPMARA